MNQKKVIRVIAIIMAILLALSLVVSVIPITAHAESYEEELAGLQAKKDEAASNLAAAQNKVEALKTEQEAAYQEKLALEERNIAAENEISLINSEIDLYNQMIDQKAQEVEAAENREATQLEKYRVRIRAMEENDGYNILSLILNASSYSGLLAAIDDYGDVMDSDKALYDQLTEAREELEEIKAEYEEYKADCEEKKADLEDQKAELEAEVAESEAYLEELKQKIEDAEEEQKAADAALAAASSSVSTFIANYEAQKAAALAAQQAAQAAQASSSSSSGETASSGDSGSNATASYDYSISGTGSFIWPFPASYKVSSTMKQRWGSFHSGIDIDGFGLEGSAIVAADGGTVILAGWNGGYGNCVIIDHGGSRYTLYGHMSSISVSQGQAVSQGEVVGGCGATGNVTGTHLHFEVRLGGSGSSNCVDPLQYFSGYVLEDGAADVS